MLQRFQRGGGGGRDLGNGVADAKLERNQADMRRQRLLQDRHEIEGAVERVTRAPLLRRGQVVVQDHVQRRRRETRPGPAQHGIKIRVHAQHRGQAQLFLADAGYDVLPAAPRAEPAGDRVVAGQAERHGKGRTGAKLDAVRGAEARPQALNMARARMENHAVAGEGGTQQAQIRLVERVVHEFVAEEIEDGNRGHRHSRFCGRAWPQHGDLGVPG